MNFFDSDVHLYISNLIEDKLSILKENNDFNNHYSRLYNLIDELNLSLSGSQKELFDELIELFYITEKYYFAFSYSLGVKYGEDLKKL